jgi:hypothetical protein
VRIFTDIGVLAQPPPIALAPPDADYLFDQQVQW